MYMHKPKCITLNIALNLQELHLLYKGKPPTNIMESGYTSCRHHFILFLYQKYFTLRGENNQWKIKYCDWYIWKILKKQCILQTHN